jgi:uncharacterized Zn finger protein
MARRKETPSWAEHPPRRLSPADGIRPRSERGSFASNWWGERWIAVLYTYGWDARLQRARSYARGGRVLSISVEPGLITAQVQGTRRTPYDVQIAIKPLSATQWERVFDALTEQALFSAQLLAGEMPSEVEDAFDVAGQSLFPTRHEIEMHCSCPDWVVPCKHVAAVYYLLGEEFDRDPFLLFRLRGREREQVMDALRARRAAGTGADDLEVLPETRAEEQAPPLQQDLTNFWQRGEGIGEFQVMVAPPPVEMALLKRMGPPPFTRRPNAFVGTLSLVYGAVTRRALEFAFGKGEDERSSSEDPMLLDRGNP